LRLAQPRQGPADRPQAARRPAEQVPLPRSPERVAAWPDSFRAAGTLQRNREQGCGHESAVLKSWALALLTVCLRSDTQDFVLALSIEFGFAWRCRRRHVSHGIVVVDTLCYANPSLE